MFPRFGAAASRESLVQLFYFRGVAGHDPLPVGKFVAAVAADLIGEELDDAVVNSVIVRFNNPFLVSIAKPKQASLARSRFIRDDTSAGQAVLPQNSNRKTIWPVRGVGYVLF